MLKTFSEDLHKIKVKAKVETLLKDQSLN